MRASMLVVGLVSLVAGFSLPSLACGDEPAGQEQDRVINAELAIRAKLAERDTFVFEEVPLLEVVDALKQQWDIPILIDKKALNEANVALDQPVSINLSEVSRKSALKLMLEPVELTYVIRDEVLMVTTREHARRNLPVRYYDVRDLIAAIEEDELKRRKTFGDSATANVTLPPPGTRLPADEQRPSLDVKPQFGGMMRSSSSEGADALVPPRFDAGDNIQTLVMETISPDSWEEAGGPGRIAMVAGVMVVSQTTDIHEEIEMMLARLRKILRNKPGTPEASAK